MLKVLSMGIDASRVKMAIKNQVTSKFTSMPALEFIQIIFQLESSGNAFESAEHLINAAFSVQREQERRSRYKTLITIISTLSDSCFIISC